MRIAVISALFPPHVIGGAEISTHQLVLGLAARGHEIHVLTTALDGRVHEKDAGFSVDRAHIPRAYNLFEVNGQPAWRKAIWHLQDHLDPRNKRVWARFLDRVKPDIALVPLPQGLGYNGLLELASRDMPTIAVLHDLSYVCYKTTMLRDGHVCETACRACAVSSRIKAGYLTALPRLGLISPSRANLRRIQSFVPVADRPSRVILNPNIYPLPDRPAQKGDRVRFLYAGQIAQAKGVEFLLSTLAAVARTHPLEMTVVGDGRELEGLRARFGGHPWVTFTGKVSLQAVANYMADSDVLCVPSIWPENSPGVIIQALQLGLPVFGSDIGGIGELVIDDFNGALLPPSSAEAWSAAAIRVIENRDVAALWSVAARADAERFAPERSVDSYESFMHEVMSLPARGTGAGQRAS